MSDRLLLHERALEGGTAERTWLALEEGTLVLRIESASHVPSEKTTAVPLAVLEGIMRRYGKPLADDVAIDGPRLVIEDRTLAMFRFRPRYDVIAKDYFVYAVAGEPPVSELATAVAGALTYLMRRVSEGEASG